MHGFKSPAVSLKCDIQDIILDTYLQAGKRVRAPGTLGATLYRKFPICESNLRQVGSPCRKPDALNLYPEDHSVRK